MKNSPLDLLIQRYASGDVSEAEREKIEAWLDAIGSGDDVDLELSEEEEERIVEKLTSSLTSIDDVASLKLRRKLRPDRWMLRVAATLVILSALSYAAWYLSGTGRLEVVSKDGVEKIILSDGSLVWLRGGSKALYYEKLDERARYVAFEGEALFEVTKDANRPFIVQCGDTRVKVLGTSFSIRSTPDLVEVIVLAGRVNFSSKADAEGLDLLPQEMAVYQSNGTFKKVEARQDEIAALIEDTDYDMQFTNTNVGKVFQRLEAKFNISIKVSDPTIRNCRITVDLTDKALDHSLRLISEVLGFKYSVEQKTVVISGGGCN